MLWSRLPKSSRSFRNASAKIEKQRRLQAWLDAGYGECQLRRPEIAGVVEAQLLAGDEHTYRLIEWTIMPNHVHALVEIEPAVEMWKVVKSWKGPTGCPVTASWGEPGSSGSPSITIDSCGTRGTFRTRSATSIGIQSRPVCAHIRPTGRSARHVCAIGRIDDCPGTAEFIPLRKAPVGQGLTPWAEFIPWSRAALSFLLVSGAE